MSPRCCPVTRGPHPCKYSPSISTRSPCALSLGITSLALKTSMAGSPSLQSTSPQRCSRRIGSGLLSPLPLSFSDLLPSCSCYCQGKRLTDKSAPHSHLLSLSFPRLHIIHLSHQGYLRGLGRLKKMHVEINQSINPLISIDW
jgi:hypothetical protein